MTRTKIVLLLLISISSILYPRERMIISHSDHLMVVREGAQFHRLSMKNVDKGIVDTIYYFHAPNVVGNYDDFIAGYQGIGKDPSDTCITWFTLLGPGKITKLFMQNEKSGLATWHIWAPSIDRNDSSYIFPNQSNARSLFSATNPIECRAQNPGDQFIANTWQPEWNILDIEVDYSTGIDINQNGLDIWIGYSMDSDGGPTIWQDGYIHDSESEGDCRAFTTLHSVEMGKWYRNIQAGNNQTWIAHMMQIEVVYEQLPPVISDISQFSDTFDKRKIVMAKIIELENQTFTPLLSYKYHGNDEWLTKLMTSVQEDSFFAELDANPGDSVYYFVSAEDETGLRAESDVSYYVVLAPPEERTVLVVKDNPWAINSLYSQAFDSIGSAYLLWDAGVHRGIDSSVINCPQFSMIAIFGCRSKIVPVLDSTSADPCDFREYLQNGGGLLLADMDYFYGWGMPTSGRFSDGDFAYDYLGIGGFENDPDDSIETEGGTADIEMTGIAGETLTVEFQTPDYYGPLRFDLIGGKSENWSDYVVPGNGGVSIFKGRQSNKDMAIRKEGSRYRSVFFSFPIELANIAEFSVLLSKTIDWLENRPVGIKNDESPKMLRNWVTNFPNPFNSNTKIQYQLKDQGISKIVVYNIYGQVVLVLVDKIQSQGKYEIEWNGRDVHGVTVASGIYFLRVETGRDVFTRKMLIIR